MRRVRRGISGLVYPAFILFLMMSCHIVVAQTPAQYVRKGDEASEKGRWDEAYSYYEQALRLDTPSFDLTRKFAEAARHIRYYKIAEELYEKNYQKDNGKLDPDGLYWLAMMQKHNGRYEDAQRNFRKYLKKHKGTGSKELVQRADQDVKSAQWAMNHINEAPVLCNEVLNKLSGGLPYEVILPVMLPAPVTTDESEISPFILGDTLFYSAYRNGIWKMMFSVDGSGASADSSASMNFQEPSELKGTLSSLSQANLWLDGEMAYFSRSQENVTGVIQASYQGNAISGQQMMEAINGKGSVNTMLTKAMSGGKEFLFFVSDREGGEGGLDIWYSVNDEGWKAPKNAGKRVNTPGDEITPMMIGDVLFFSSDWHEGFGGHDVFVSNFNGSSFEKPVNAGSWINSSLNDFSCFITTKKISDEGFNLYFSSNRRHGNESDFCCNDLYMARVVVRQTKDDGVLRSEGLSGLMEELPVVLYFHNDEPNPDSWDTTTTVSYRDAYSSYLKMIPTYIRENTRGLSGDKREDAENITTDFFDLKVRKGMDDLDTFKRLLLDELERGSSLRVDVRGFASPRAQSDYNLNLTKRRTASLVNLLLADSGGVFLPYVNDVAANGAHLEFELLPFGEYKSDLAVSDDLVDEKNSIYSRAACLERKIEIERVSVIEHTVKKHVFRMDSTVHDFGVIPKHGKVTHDFSIYNSGNALMYIDSVVAECGCTEPLIDKSILQPGEKATLHVGFDPLSRQGVDEKNVMIYIRGEEPRIITIRAQRSRE